MASLKGIAGRLRGDRVNELARDVAELRELLLGVNHATQAIDGVNHAVHGLRDGMQALIERLDAINHNTALTQDLVARLVELCEAQQSVLLDLNHDVRSGAEDALPLFIGYTERLRLDTDTAIGAAQVIERQLAVLEDLVAASAEPEPS